MEGFPRNERHTPSPAQEAPGFDHDAIRESAEYVVSGLEDIPDFQEFTDITSMYRTLAPDELIVRREDPEQLLRLMTNHEPLQIGFAGNTPYANSVVWKPDLDGPLGLNNAFLEGYSHLNHIVTVYGFVRPDGFHFEQLSDSQQSFAHIDRTRVRSAAGYVPPEAVRFVTVRIPIHSFPKERMTEEEHDRLWEYEELPPEKREPAFIYRGFLAKQ